MHFSTGCIAVTQTHWAFDRLQNWCAVLSEGCFLWNPLFIFRDLASNRAQYASALSLSTICKVISPILPRLLASKCQTYRVGEEFQKFIQD